MAQFPMKASFGKHFRAAREAKSLSRAALGKRLGISPKTIQSWEMGRTFPENLSLIPAIETELGVSFTQMIGESMDAASRAAEPGVTYGARRGSAIAIDHAAAGPQPVDFSVAGSMDEKELDEADYMAVPVLKPSSAGTEVSAITEKDIDSYTLFPSEWATRSGILVGVRMRDSALEPSIPHGSMVVIDRRVTDAERLNGKIAALWLHDRGLRVRRIHMDLVDRSITGLPERPGARGKVDVDLEKGDRFLGKIVCFTAKLD